VANWIGTDFPVNWGPRHYLCGLWTFINRPVEVVDGNEIGGAIGTPLSVWTERLGISTSAGVSSLWYFRQFVSRCIRSKH
jgi:hypothetical protein